MSTVTANYTTPHLFAQSILLSPPQFTHVRPSPSTSTASSSASSTSSHTSIPTPGRSGSLRPPSHRRIRFAPLPDPRRDDEDYIDADMGPHLDPQQLGAKLSCLPAQPYPLDDESIISSDFPDSSSCPSPVPQKSNSPLPPAVSPTVPPAKPKSLSLLRPFKKSSPGSSSSSSSHSLTPTQSLDAPTPTNGRSSPLTPGHSSAWSRINFSTEEILTLGTINLFRTSSKNNDPSPSSSSPGWGLGLTRWTSTGSATKSGSPLARSQSAQPFSSSSNPAPSKKTTKHKPRSNSIASTNSSTSNPATTGTALTKSTSLPARARKGTRMLNGRVYGGPKRNAANPFANVRDEDPEFVEWGYGGMGSVRGGTSAGVNGADGTRWERLQSSGRGVVVGSFASAGTEKKGVGGVVRAPHGGNDDDDGSGMGWVKKRKEAREREKKEREEKEKQEREAAAAAAAPELTPSTLSPVLGSPGAPQPAIDGAPTPSAPTPADPVDASTAPAPAAAPAPVDNSAPSSLIGTPTASPLPSSDAILPASGAPEPEHILRAVTLPAHLPRHHHHHHHGHGIKRVASRGTSAEMVPTVASVNGHGVVGEVAEKGPVSVAVEEIGSGSESESETESEDEEAGVRKGVVGEEEEEDEDEEEDEVEERKTALGAGVEVVSRHN